MIIPVVVAFFLFFVLFFFLGGSCTQIYGVRIRPIDNNTTCTITPSHNTPRVMAVKRFSTLPSSSYLLSGAVYCHARTPPFWRSTPWRGIKSAYTLWVVLLLCRGYSKCILYGGVTHCRGYSKCILSPTNSTLGLYTQFQNFFKVRRV